MSFDLTNKNIQDTFQNLLQKTGSDGRLYDLVGNSVRDLTIDGTLTANTYITSQSIVNTSSGSTAFGNSSDDTHLFTGNMTASGEISASDDIKGKNFLGKIGSFGVGSSNQPDPTIPSNNDIQLFVTRNGSTAQALIERVGNGELLLTAGASDVEVGTRNNYPLHLIHNNTDRVKIDAGGIDVIGHITASGNISGSGTGSFSDGRFSGFVGIGNGGSAIAPEALLHLQNTEDDKYLQRWTLNNIEGGIFGDASGDVLKIQVNSNDALAFTTNATERVRIAKDGGTSFTSHITASGNISSSGDIFAHSGSFTYITASIIDVDGDTIRFGGESFTKANIQTLKQGRSLKPIRVGKSRPDFEAEDGRFDGNITASGDIINTQTIQMTNSSSVINTFNTKSHKTCKYVLQVTSGSHIQSSEMLVMVSASSAVNTEYAQINSGLNLLDFSSNINGSNVELIGSSSFISCSVKLNRKLI